MADTIGKVGALQQFFGTEAKPVTTTELMDFRRHDMEGFDELAQLAARALGKILKSN